MPDEPDLSSFIPDYELLGGPDEMFDANLHVRSAYKALAERLARWQPEDLASRQERADLALLNAGITFTVYADEQGTERIFPFSLIPRIIQQSEWNMLEQGLAQRVRALNLFLKDIYTNQRAITDGVIPAEVVFGAASYRLRMVGVEPPLDVYTHIVGCDLVRNQQGQYVVLEDNLRTPSGVSYVMENRTIMLRVCPDLFPPGRVSPVADYPGRLLSTLIEVRPSGVSIDETNVVVLTPGRFNSAYFEHAFLAQQMGVQLVDGTDLIVHKDEVFLRSTAGLQRVHVIYRRIDDDFLDPVAFRPDSEIGVPGLMNAYASGGVTLVNAIGTGVADDKVVYRFVPDLVRYYLGDEPILGNVDTYTPILEDDQRFILENLDQLVIKPANEAGGYGIVIGPQADKAKLAEAREAIETNPRNWLAQPLVEFSTIPTIAGDKLAPRRADIRPYILTGASTWVLPGGLTRVALQEGSYIVNSSQGGGSKDTWVLTSDEATNAE